jgi:hypothetical protein
MYSDKYSFDFRVDGDKVTHLFFAHKESIGLVRRYGSGLLMYCTYKVNKFWMPLLEVFGMTSFWTTFFCCFVFLAEEKQEDYNWALRKIGQKLYDGIPHPTTIATDRELALMNAMPGVFPSAHNVLCMWHIEKSILTNCRRHFSNDDDWNDFLAAWNSGGTILGRSGCRQDLEPIAIHL